MITLDAFIVFLGAALIPVIYILLMSRWIEPEYRRAHPKDQSKKAEPAAESANVLQHAWQGAAR